MQNTFPKFTNMIPTVEDVQLIVDSLREEDRKRITKDGIFTPGIVNEKGEFLSLGTNANSIKIKPFIGYSLSGNRIEVSSAWDNLYPSGSSIYVTDANKISEYENIPVWYTYNKNYTNLESEESLTEMTIKLATLGKGSILQGIKLKTNELFNIPESSNQPNIWVSIGIEGELDKFLPETLVSEDSGSQDLSVMNLMYSLDDSNETDILITFKSDSVNLNTITSGSLTTNLLISNLSGFDNSNLTKELGGINLSSAVGTWQPTTTYHIVVRYKEIPSNNKSLNYTDSNGIVITTNPEPTRLTTDYDFFALRKSGSTIDTTTSDDIKIGEVETDADGNISKINVNGVNPRTGNEYTQYLTIPGYRYTSNINAEQIADGSVNNTEFQYLSTLNGNVQTQLNSKVSKDTDNIITGSNKFTQQIDGDIKSVNGFTAFATPTPNNLLVLDENAKVPADAISESTIASIGNFYTVSSGVTENGRSSFIKPNDTKDGVTLTATQQNPLVLNYPDGSVEKITNTRNIGGLAADGFYYLVKEKNGNFVFLPTTGGTKACIPTVSSGNSFVYGDSTGTVRCFYENSTAYKAFNGNIVDGTKMGQVTYTNYKNVETIGYNPSSDATYLDIDFPVAISPTGFAACFRKNQYDATPKYWVFEGSNDNGNSWTQIYSSSTGTEASTPTTWNINEIKTIATPNQNAYKKFRFTFNVNGTTINNYMLGEETPATGVTLPIMCYYFQIYATNTDTTNKGNIVEGYTLPQDMSIGSYFLDISKKPYIGKKIIGNNQTEDLNFVKLGFVNLTGYGTSNTVLTTYPFCYNTFTLSETTALNINSIISFNHNLGVIPNIIDIKFKCLSENNGYSVGDVVNDIYANTTSGLISVKNIFDTTVTTISMIPCTATETLLIRNKSTKQLSSISNSQWGVVIYCSRGW